MIIVVMLLGAGLVYWLLQSFYARTWNKNLEAEIYFSVDHAVMGDTVELVEILTNRKWLPLPFIHVKFQLDRSFDFGGEIENAQISDKTYRNDIFSLLMYQRITRKIPVKCTKRGVYRIDRIELISTGMFMNEVLAVHCPQQAQITVYPKAEDVQGMQAPFSKLTGTVEKNRWLFEDPFVFRGIREYHFQDSMNTINWKASARTGALMVNQYNETLSQEICVLLNLEPEGVLRYDLLSEASISIAAGLIQLLIEQGVPTSLISNGRDAVSSEDIRMEPGGGFDHINAINTALARIDLSKEQTDFIALLNQEKDKKGERILYVMISQNRRTTLQKYFDGLTVHPQDCMWIIPYLDGMESGLEWTHAQTVQWEVTHYGR